MLSEVFLHLQELVYLFEFYADLRNCGALIVIVGLIVCCLDVARAGELGRRWCCVHNLIGGVESNSILALRVAAVVEPASTVLGFAGEVAGRQIVALAKFSRPTLS